MNSREDGSYVAANINDINAACHNATGGSLACCLECPDVGTVTQLRLRQTPDDPTSERWIQPFTQLLWSRLRYNHEYTNAKHDNKFGSI